MVMNMYAVFCLWIGVAYLCGSIPFGKLVGRYYGKDIQSLGSGNIGFANVRRILGWKPGIVVLVADVLKGFVPVTLAMLFLLVDQVLVVALAAIIGHVFPAWIQFRGGKGVATGLGITLALVPIVGLLGFLVYLIGVAALKKSAPASVAAGWSLPVASAVIYPDYVNFFVVLALLGTWTHRNNIRTHFGKQSIDNA